ncbi:hypothetical protein Pflav_036950 [Phytohabitans flavus]|uniref:Glycosyltransferase RgtA/B/C/D-like domain-containing protein n=1 Tax=Phytohabitans flavus TaxID=1076124 RepID=A0A6F8XTY2_9ACTN|nr:hypothetical protein Pflav_036950 [Phytohabitans flavus]
MPPVERALTDVPPEKGLLPRALRRPWLLVVLAAPALFVAYLLISRQLGVNADGASNAIQAREMLHGNLLLRGWTVTDVSFYTNELLLFMLVELVYGFHHDTTHATAALVLTLVVLVVAAAAKGRATGREAAGRIAVAVAIVAVPALGHAATTLLTSPDHTGTAIPLLATWLVLEWARPGRGLPLLIAAMLAWAQIADPLVMYIGVLPSSSSAAGAPRGNARGAASTPASRSPAPARSCWPRARSCCSGRPAASGRTPPRRSWPSCPTWAGRSGCAYGWWRSTTARTHRTGTAPPTR